MFYLLRILRLKVQKKSINSIDISHSYDAVADSYESWLEMMKKYTNQIIQPHNNKAKILDLCSGTGYIANTLFDSNKTLQITAVDISKKMLDKNTNQSIKKIQMDAKEFLTNNTNLYDAIYIGYALPYIEEKGLYKNLYQSLQNQGDLVFITNIKGTLKNSYKLIFDIIKNHKHKTKKVFNVTLKSKRYYQKKLLKNNFSIKKIDVVEEVVRFKEKDMFITWLLSTGAFAGVQEMFDNIDLRKEFEQRVDKYYLIDQEYSINHRFLQVIARKEG